MKTRREFFRTLAGSCAVVAACVVAPKSLIAKEELPTATYGYQRLYDVDLDTQVVTVATSESKEIKEYDHVMQWTGKTWKPYVEGT